MSVYVSQAIAVHPGGGRRMLLCGSSGDVIGHFLKSRDSELTEAIGSELITASDEKLLAAYLRCFPI
jgi:hypothetical protein